MLHETIIWGKLSYDELIGMIREAQRELEKRGTITHCQNIDLTFNRTAKAKFITAHVTKEK